ncbi:MULTISPECIES: ABC transporter permease [unclassified Clostridium]|uniref:ABC transporter permease n=1 Tax=unclassified Clostridium TaxID=2614128 RepID=UPI00023AF768|nr:MULTISPECIES: ABC transporter permease [unclassified Clostridium]EHI96836.1 ABC-type transporter, integral membrane subunit [Clostridium sp. DL-VIII]OOM76958.1 dipeptide transport system permease protein DppB [Clostridium sp. BL-8]
MRKYVFKRLIQSIPVLFGISIIVFILVKMQPGDPFSSMMDPNLTKEMQKKMLDELGYNDPILIQYFKWLLRALQGNLGYSIQFKQPVLTVIASRLGNTVILSLCSMILSILIAIPCGVISATKQRTKTDYVVTVFAFMGLSIPSFFFGMLLIKIFSVDLGWLPISGMVSTGVNLKGWAAAFDIAKHMILPMIVLALINTASLMRYTRSDMIEILKTDYIRTARAKGVRRRSIIYQHALKNELLPLITVVTMQIPALLSGALLTETIFVWPGIGRLNFNAVMSRDYPLIMGIVMMVAVISLLTNLLADILYAVVDKRINFD